MVGRVVVMEPAAFQAWLAEGPPAPSMTAEGGRLFAKLNCATCHTDSRKAPSLAGSFGSVVTLADGRRAVVDADYLRESILSPRARLVSGFPPVMPAYQGQLNESQVMDLVAYIESMGSEKGATGR
jgi:cytochrome c oxidase subunit 2